MKTARTILLAAASTSLAAIPAMAADLLEPPPEVVVVQPFSWTGPFGGLFGGGAFSDSDVTARYTGIGVDSESFNDDDFGVFGGVQLGFDFEYNRFVLGAVADIALTSLEHRASGPIGGFAGVNAETDLVYLGTLRGRLGYAVMDRLLVYGHGGLAYGGVDHTVSVDGVGTLSSDDETKLGYVIGAGLEYAITNNISVQAEYGYYDLGTDRMYSGPVLGGDNLRVEEDLDFHAVKAAINYRF